MKSNFYYGVLFFIGILYGLLSVNSPINPTSTQYGFTPESLFFLKLTIIIPYVISWGLTLYGILHLKLYIESIGGSQDGKAFVQINKALSILLVSNILATFYWAYP